MKKKHTNAVIIALGIAVIFLAQESAAQVINPEGQVIFGLKLKAGGRFDNVRMCVGSPPGVKGGPAMDISFFTEISVSEKISVSFDVPVMRPILFGASFKMLQFEPVVTLLFKRHSQKGSVNFVAGPSLGITLHYGPDYKSEKDGENRRSSFFAMGPKIGGYAGIDFARPGETFNFQLGLSPYISPLFSVSDPDNHRGVVIGGTLDGLFRFSTK